jgi:hypothetical protein
LLRKKLEHTHQTELAAALFLILDWLSIHHTK